jgi:site-specific DNA recombinase
MRAGSKDQNKSVGIWLRVSTEDQVRGESPEHHERRARAYVEAKGWHVAEVYRLDAVSGKAVMAHAESQRMLGDVRAGFITGLVFSKLARLARNTKELLEFAEIFRACDADLVSLAEAIDTSTAAGRLFFTMIAAMAEWEREEIADRVRASVPIRAALGKPTGGAAPFGYQWKDKCLVPDPVEVPVRLLVHELFVEHRRKKTVARLLNERGYRTRNGGKWSDTTIERLLRDPTAKGLRRANYTQTSDRTKGWELKPETEWVWSQVEPIVPEDVWERCVCILDAQKMPERKPAKKAVHLFTGYAFCACGGPMRVRYRSVKYDCETCHNKIPTDDLEAVYREQLTGFLVSETDVAAHREAANDAMREKAQLIGRAESELKRNGSDEDELFRLYHEGAFPTADFGRRHRPLSERRAQLENELPRLQAELDVLRISTLSQEAALEDARDLANRWPGMAAEERRQIVEAITDRIVVGSEDVEINLLHLSSPSTPSTTSGRMATKSQGFIAATNCTRAG